MTSPTFKVYNSAGTLTFDADVAIFGCVIDVITVSASTTPTYNYSLFSGKTAVILEYGRNTTWGVTINYSSGYPSISFSSCPYDRLFVIFAF